MYELNEILSTIKMAKNMKKIWWGYGICPSGY